jgi:mannan endo-1,4-beta-mannosidase
MRVFLPAVLRSRLPRTELTGLRLRMLVAAGAALVVATGGLMINQVPRASAGTADVVGVASCTTGGGWDVTAQGAVTAVDGTATFGDVGSLSLKAPIVGMAGTPDCRGYWLVAADGGIFSFGDAAFYGSTGGLHLNRPIVGMASTADGRGYWLVASDGGIFAFGDAAFHGSTGGLHLNRPVVGMAATPDGGGYWLVASDGGIFSFGDAAYHGSTGSMHLAGSVVGMASTSDGQGYWLVSSDGGVFSFGDAPFRGSDNSQAAAVVGMARTGLSGYALVAANGAVSMYGADGDTPTTAATPDSTVTPASASTSNPAAKHEPDESAYVTRTGDQLSLAGKAFRFSGTNMYWLALDDNTPTLSYPTDFEIDDAMATAEAMGDTVVRAWADTVGCQMCIEPSLGSFNPAALQSLDYAVASAKRHGIHLILTLVDNWNYYNGGKTTWTNWEGVSESAFFTDQKVIGDYEAFIDHVLTHVDPDTGLAYDQDPTIMGWETGNEIYCQTCTTTTQQYAVEASWTNTVATYIKTLAPDQLVVDGLGVQASCTSGCLNPAALASPAVDMVDDHFYPMDDEREQADAAQAAAASKAYFVGEYDWDNYDGGDSLPSFLSAIQSGPAAGDLFWVLIPHDSDGGFQDHDDGFQYLFPGSNSDQMTRTGELRAHAYAMTGVAPPTPAVVGPPTLLKATSSSGSVALVWQGSSGAASYDVQRMTGGTWVTVATGVTDPIAVWAYPVGWTDTSPGSGLPQYRMASVNLAGVAGAWSAPLTATAG